MPAGRRGRCSTCTCRWRRRKKRRKGGRNWRKLGRRRRGGRLCRGRCGGGWCCCRGRCDRWRRTFDGRCRRSPFCRGGREGRWREEDVSSGEIKYDALLYMEIYTPQHLRASELLSVPDENEKKAHKNVKDAFETTYKDTAGLPSCHQSLPNQLLQACATKRHHGLQPPLLPPPRKYSPRA